MTSDILTRKIFKSVEMVNGMALTRTANEGIKFMKNAGLCERISLFRGELKNFWELFN